MEISTQGPVITFIPDDSIRGLLGFNKTTIYEEYSLSPNPVDILSFDNIFLECDIAQSMIFKGETSGTVHNFAMDVDPGYKYIEKIRGGVQWYMMETKDILSSICFKLKKMKITNSYHSAVKVSLFDYQSRIFKRWIHTIISVFILEIYI